MKCDESDFVSGSFLFGAVEFGDFVAVGNEDDAGAVDEQAVLNDAGDVAEFERERRRIGNATEVAIEDVMAFVGDERLSVFLADHYGGSELLNFAAHERQREGDDFYRHGKAAEHCDLFAGVGDDDEFARGGRDDFFVEERAAATLDQVELWIEFVGAVDCHIDVLHFVEVGERNAEPARHFASVVRGGNATNFEAGCNAFANELDGVSGRRACPEANDLAVFHELNCGARSGFFFFFVGHGWAFRCPKNAQTNVPLIGRNAERKRQRLSR
jgi:hypothetical protein